MNFPPLLEYKTNSRNGVEVGLEHEVGLRPCAVEEDELKVLASLLDGLGHGHEGRDAAAARQGHDAPAVADARMGDVPAGLGGRQRVAHLGLVVQPGGEEAALLELDRDAVLALQRLLRAGREGIGAPRDGAREHGADVNIAAGLEGGQSCGALLLVGDEDEALGVVLGHLRPC